MGHNKFDCPETMPGPEAKTPHRKPGLRHDMTKTLYLQPQDLAPKNKVVFLKPALPDKIRTPRLAHCPPESTGDRDEMDGDDGKKYTTTYTFRGGKLPNTPGFWMDLMLYNAAMKSYDVGSLTSFCPPPSPKLLLLSFCAFPLTRFAVQIPTDVSQHAAAARGERRAKTTEKGALGLRARRGQDGEG